MADAAATGKADVPVATTLEEAMRQFRRPFTPEAVKFKVQTNPKEDKKGLVVAYHDSRLVTERLNAIAPDMWSDTYQGMPHVALPGQLPGVLCRIKLALPDANGNIVEVVRSDVGVTSQKLDSDMGIKAIYSDAFKRAGVKLGIGVSLYAFPQQYVTAQDLDQRGSKFYMNARTETKLRGAYRKWLNDHGVKLFGEPLDHGDLEGAQGDFETNDSLPADVALDVPEHGPEASDAALAQFERALAFLVDGDLALVAKWRDKIAAKFGYMPEAAVLGVGLAATAVIEARRSAETPETPAEQQA